MDNKNIEDALGHIMQGQKEKSSPTSNNCGVGQSITVGQLYMLIDKQRQLIEDLLIKVAKNQLNNCFYLHNLL